MKIGFMMNNKTKSNAFITEHFQFRELVCPCCERIKVIPALFKHMELLEKIRVNLNFPLVVGSGYRCPERNKQVEGKNQSWHLLFATDIHPEEFSDNYKDKLRLMYQQAIELNFGGIGLYENRGFIHLDMRPNKTRWRE